MNKLAIAFFFIFSTALIANKCEKENQPEQVPCPITIDDIDTIEYSGEIVEHPLNDDFRLHIPVDVYFFIDTTKTDWPTNNEVIQLFDKVNTKFATVRKDGKIQKIPHYFRYYPNNTYKIHSTHNLEYYYQSYERRDSLIQHEIEDPYNVINLLFFESETVLNGFAPTLAYNFEELEHTDLTAAYAELYSFNRYASTVSHELAHLNGMVHPWELKEKAPERYKLLNLDYPESDYNIGAYGCYVDHLTIEQLTAQYLFAIKYRSNILR